MSNSENQPKFGPENAVTSGLDEQSHDRPTDEDLEAEFEQAAQEVEETNDTKEGDQAEIGVQTPSESDDVYSPVNHEYDVPYVMFRERSDTWRGGPGRHKRYDVFPETAEKLDETYETLMSDLNMDKKDIIEILLRVGMQNMDEVRAEATRWGFRK